jgi:hypothetical protein
MLPAIPTDAMPAAEFLIRHLYRPIELTDSACFFAVTETEHLVGGDNWFWTDDNAKVLEFLSRPEIWRRFPDHTAEMLRFVQSMCRGPFMFRRVSSPRLETADGQGADARYVHSLMHVKPDLARGIVIVGVRFHDTRTADHLHLTGNCVTFSHNGRRFTVDVEKSIGDVEVAHNGLSLTLRHSGELYFKPRWRSVLLGRINYVYTFDARSMLLSVEATLDVDPHAEVADVELTIGHDSLSHEVNEVRYNTVAANTPGSEPVSFAAGEPGRHVMQTAGASYYSISQAEIAGFALAVHSVPREPDRLSKLEVEVRQRGKLHTVRAHYRFAGSCRGAHLVASEDKLLTAGGFYGRIADYVELMRDAVMVKPQQQAALDYSISYDYGAEINALAKCYAVSVAEQIALGSYTSAEELRGFIDKYLGYYLELFVVGHYEGKNTILSRQLAFVILAAVTMYRVTTDEAYLAAIKKLCDVLLDFEVRFDDIAGQPASGFPYGMASHRSAFVDGHSASLLALTQAIRCINDPRFAQAIDRGLASYCIETASVNIGRPVKIDVLATSIGLANGHRHTENAYWNFNVGLALRFFAALRNSPNADLQAIAARHRDRIELFEMVLRWQLQRSITERDDSIEIRTSMHAAETNSETQPWVMLGLLGHPYD